MQRTDQALSSSLLPIALAVLLLLATQGLHAQAGVTGANCQPAWMPTFGGEPGTSHAVRDFTVFDDGSGSALFACGDFLSAGGVSSGSIAKWDGSGWSSLGAGVSPGGGYALEVFDDGSGGGPALYMGGGVSAPGGDPAFSVAKWDGTQWSELGNLPHDVYALAVYDDGAGGGPALYAGGSFESIGGLPSRAIARWDGAQWSPVGTGLGGDHVEVFTLATFDDGSGAGPALYVGGLFETAGGQLANNIAKWDGAQWSALETGVAPIAVGPLEDLPYVVALAAYDDGSGSGPCLYAGGWFGSAGGSGPAFLARWDGSAWSGVGNGPNGAVEALAVLDDGSGVLSLYAGGAFSAAGGVPTACLAKLTGTSWSVLGGGLSLDAGVFAVAAFDDGSGTAIYAGGNFLSADGVAASRIARWDGTAWSALGDGINDAVYALAVHDDGSGGGPELYASGSFTSASGQIANRIAKWDGASWSPLGSGAGGVSNPYVYALASCEGGLGDGPSLFAAGHFATCGGVSVNSIARWDGTQWWPVGNGLGGFVRALGVFDDGQGGGPALYAQSGTGSGVKRWNGSSWTGLPGAFSSGADDMVVFDVGDGHGPALYVAGSFVTIGSTTVNRIARWNGTSWSPLGSGMNKTVEAVAVFDDGSGDGPALYAAGYFVTAGGVAASRIAKWDGASWSPLGEGLDEGVLALAIYDDGSGPALFAGGYFQHAGGVPANGLARWNGSSWSAVASGVIGGVKALVVFGDGGGTGPALIAGGDFTSAPDSADSYVARWLGCADATAPWTNVGYILPGSNGPPLLGGMGSLQPGSPGALALTHAAPSAPAALCISLVGTPKAFKGGTLASTPVLLSYALVTDPAGALQIPFAGWPAGVSGFSLWFQYAILDAGATQGVALSNGLRADVP